MQKRATKPATMNLVLDSLEIQGFRGFRHLTIERLGRVNLIVGKNGVGKSALLEAFWLYAAKGSPKAIWEILGTRDEATSTILNQNDPILEEYLITAVNHLFHGREDIRRNRSSIQIGPLNSKDKTLTIMVNMLEQDSKAPYSPSLGIIIDIGTNGSKITYPLHPYIAQRIFAGQDIKSISVVIVLANGLYPREIGGLWDRIALTNLEEYVLNALRILTPTIERLSFIESYSGDERIPIIKVAGFDSPLHLRSMGEGMNRIFGITLALVNAKDGVLLIDEIENGLHYSIQTNMWRLIFEVARRLNVQVFATTHSWDCIEAFTKAAIEDKQEEGMLIRLSERKGDIVPTLYNEQELAIATRSDIEVR